MFSGLIEEVGKISARKSIGDGVEFIIAAKTVTMDMRIDDSISVQGVCLTVVECSEHHFRVQCIEETLSKTSLGLLQEGMSVNLERALLPTTRMGGHFVQGHVDCKGRVRSVTQLSTSHEIWIEYPQTFSDLVVVTGSICVNGISLTVARREEQACMVAIIPHTWNETTIRDCAEGVEVNLEFDVLGKYVQAIMQNRKS